MVDFWAVATSPVAVNKFFHTVLSGWVLGGVFVVGIGCWYLLKKRNREFALASIKIGAIFGLVASLLSVWTGDGSGYQIAQTQPMKLAAVEGLYEGGTNVGLVGIGMLNPKRRLIMTEKNLSCSVLRYRVCFRSLPSVMSMLMFRELRILSKVAINRKTVRLLFRLPKRLNGVNGYRCAGCLSCCEECRARGRCTSGIQSVAGEYSLFRIRIY